MTPTTRKEATGRPWVHDHHAFPFNVYSDDATGSIIATCDGFRLAPRSDAEKHANAALIVEAVNSLEPNERRIAELTEALREARVEIARLRPGVLSTDDIKMDPFDPNYIVKV